MPVRVGAMRPSFQNRFRAQCVALVLLLVIVAVLVAPMVNLPRCANRAKRAAAMLQWLLTCALLLVSAKIPVRAVREPVLRAPAGKGGSPGALRFPGPSVAVLLC